MPSTHIRVFLTNEERQYINEYVPTEARSRVLLAEADRASGKMYQELTKDLPEDLAQALTLGTMFVGADSSDMDTFVCDALKAPVTEENFGQVVELFQAWYRLVAPHEYHEPKKPSMLGHGWFR